MKILVCGGRKFADVSLMNRALTAAQSKHGSLCIIHGDASGADRMAARWAQEKGLAVISCPANWAHYGKKAGPIRNQWMLDFALPDAIIAMPGGVGTADMCRRAEQAGLPVWRVATKP